MKSKLYQWHKKLGLLVLVPLILWTLSGIIHPIMGWIKPTVAQRYFVAQKTTALDSTAVRPVSFLPDSITAMHMVSLPSGRYYSVVDTHQKRSYYNAYTAEKSEKAITEHAVLLARHFSGDKTSKIKNVTYIDQFTPVYREINRLLPVYKVTLDRSDGATVYVDIATNRLGTINTTSREFLLQSFAYLHNWSFLDFSPVLQHSVVFIFCLLSFIAGSIGLIFYLLLWKKYKKASPKSKAGKIRKYHRQIGFFISIYMLLFAFSGCYHVLVKIPPKPIKKTKITQVFATKALQDGFSLMQKAPASAFICYDHKNYIQVKDKKQVRYQNIQTKAFLPKADSLYAIALAQQFSGYALDKITDVEKITRFNHEYGFISKRLPVWKVAYATSTHDTYYIETTTNTLALQVVDAKRKEGFSFAFLHKYHFLDFLGKDIRNGIMIFLTLLIAIVSILGLKIYLK